MKIIIILSIIILGLSTGCSFDLENKQNNIKANTNQSLSNESANNKYKYVEDKVVDKFLVDFSIRSNYEIKDIEKGNIKTKYFLYINDQYVEILNATNPYAETFNITIYGGNDEEDIKKILNVYREVIKVLDNTMTDEKIKKLIDEKIINSSADEQFNVNDNIKTKFYDSVQLSTYKTGCRIEIETTLYNEL